MSPQTMSRRDSVRALLSLLLLPAAVSCSPPRAPLSVAAHPWPGYALMFLAAREAWIASDAVRLVDTSSATESMQRLKAGEIDAAGLTLDETLSLLVQGVRLQVVLVFNLSSGADALIAKPHVADLRALAGKRVGVENTAVGALMLKSALNSVALKPQDVDVVPITVDQHLAAWERDEIDAVVSFEPVVGRLMAAHGRMLFDSTALPDTIIDVLAVSARAMDDAHKRRALEALVKGHFLALHHLRSNPADAAYRLAPRLGGSGPDALQSFRGLLLPDEHENRQLLHPNGRLLEVADRLSQLMLEWGHIERRPALDHLVDDRLLPRPEDLSR